MLRLKDFSSCLECLDAVTDDLIIEVYTITCSENNLLCLDVLLMVFFSGYIRVFDINKISKMFSIEINHLSKFPINVDPFSRATEPT